MNYKTALSLPDEVVAQGIHMRAMTEDDLPFVLELYVAGRWMEMDMGPAVHWNHEQKVAFLTQQGQLQHAHYMRHYAETDYGILEREGVAIGRLYLHRTDNEIRIVDISLMPDWRSRGIGGALIRAVFDEARPLGKKVSIHVEKNNPAMRLYDRLGFQAVSETGPYWLMEWLPGDTGDPEASSREAAFPVGGHE